MTETLEGAVTAVIFSSGDHSFCVFRLKEKETGRITTVAGQAGTPYEGEKVIVRGCWQRHPRFGLQFHADTLDQIKPKAVDEIRQFLATGLVKGVGPAIAQRIVDFFGSRTLDVMDQHIESLLEVPGIGPKTLDRIRVSYRGTKELRNLVMMLQTLGISARYAAAIQKAYKEDAERILREDPYRMTEEIAGLGFRNVDRIAQATGTAADDEARIIHGIFHVLSVFSREGHCCAPATAVCREAAFLLQIDENKISTISREAVDIGEIPAVFYEEKLYLYLPSLYEAETNSARYLQCLMKDASVPIGTPALAMKRFEKEEGVSLAPEQREAVNQAMRSGVMVITGGPGTGKTTLVKAIIAAVEQYNQKVQLMAPTGRAAKRLSLASGRHADTIHKSLEAGKRGDSVFFDKNESDPLDADIIIVDEASMIDMYLFYRLLCALKKGARLILVGDVDQLPPVGPGTPLKGLIAWEQIPVVRLEHIFRQEEGSSIIRNAVRIHEGILPETDEKGEFQIRFVHSEEEAYNLVMALCHTLGYEEEKNQLTMQILSPMYKGLCGVNSLNQSIQRMVHESDGETPSPFIRGDKVMQNRNDYEKGVYNGDIGIVWAVSAEKLFVRFPEKELVYDKDEWSSLQLAWASTVHKSQGSEYDTVVLVLLPSQVMMLQRNLFYTAVTRARWKTVLVTTDDAMRRAVHNNRIAGRCSLFLPLLKGEAQS